MLLQQPDAIAVVASLGLGGLSGLPLPFSVPLAYGAMVASQTRGLDIIGLLHNCTAQQTAAAPPDNVDADLPMDALCAGYEAHHWESTSNCLHACGMLWAFGVLALMLLRQKRWPMLALVPPCWYLFAWTGHFVFQAGGSVMGGPERRLPPSPQPPALGGRTCRLHVRHHPARLVPRRVVLDQGVRCGPHRLSARGSSADLRLRGRHLPRPQSERQPLHAWPRKAGLSSAGAGLARAALQSIAVADEGSSVSRISQ